ncbi:UTP-glucose-1-phosphate uridylyltransferase, partial [Blyttiomyces sp. JEL0837]
MEIIVNLKTTDGGEKVIQLETAVGAAIKHFNGAHGVNVPRSRFLPVKSCSDLFLITSDLYSLNHGQLIMNPARHFQTVPLVKLGDHFKKVNNYLARFKSPPHILELDHLTVTGDVTFGADVVLRGTVIIVANHGERIDIPSGAILDDKKNGRDEVGKGRKGGEDDAEEDNDEEDGFTGKWRWGSVPIKPKNDISSTTGEPFNQPSRRIPELIDYLSSIYPLNVSDPKSEDYPHPCVDQY